MSTYEHHSSDMDLEEPSNESHEKIMQQFSIKNKNKTEDDTESIHSFHSIQSDRLSVKSTQSESKLILNDLKTKLNQQKSVWNDIKCKTNKYIELYLLNSSYDKTKLSQNNDETQSLHSNPSNNNNEMDDKQKKLYIRLQNNLIADLMKEKNKLNDKYIKCQADYAQNVKNTKSMKQEINEKNQMINDYKQLLSNTVNDMNKQNKLQKEINVLVEKVSFKENQITKSTKAFITISNNLSDYINHIDHTTNYINYKINKLNQNLNKIQRKHQILILKTKDKNSTLNFKKQLKEKDDLIQSLIQQKINLIQETSKQFNLQRNLISKYQKERLRQNYKIKRKYASR